ncbi:reverse transcriptase family protein [Hansschlegelia sp. KR7-227]|uniref:reverse transcriptase family protein n=1 Tax=Hansschlegelia sp. KR7-227 TaxID=3400914 RepID=UPI003C043908
MIFRSSGKVVIDAEAPFGRIMLRMKDVSMRGASEPFSYVLPSFDDLFAQIYVESANEFIENLTSRNLPVLFDVSHLAHGLGYHEYTLYSITNDPSKFYRKFLVAKKNGGKRKIVEPLPTLKDIQRKLLRHIFQRIPTSRAARAYKYGFGVKGNAQLHRAQKYIVRLDFSDFFGSIRRAEVRNVIFELGYTARLASFISRLVTFDGSLPQGAPTSPAISNIVMREFDRVALDYCKDRNLRYSRYADDIVISGETLHFVETVRYFRSLARRHGRVLNEDKTIIMPPGRRKVVTGLVVNEFVNVPRSYKRLIRQEMYYIRRFGLDAHLLNRKEARRNYLNHLLGKVNYVQFVRPSDEFQSYGEQIKALIALRAT